MRPALAILRRAGIIRARFSARYAGRSLRGHIILSEVETPIGDSIDHLWIERGDWRGTTPQPGQQIEFRATIEPYWRDSGEQDLGLFRLERL